MRVPRGPAAAQERQISHSTSCASSRAGCERHDAQAGWCVEAQLLITNTMPAAHLVQLAQPRCLLVGWRQVRRRDNSLHARQDSRAAVRMRNSISCSTSQPRNCTRPERLSGRGIKWGSLDVLRRSAEWAVSTGQERQQQRNEHTLVQSTPTAPTVSALRQLPARVPLFSKATAQ